MFENFPYTDMHQLNLDWIIKIAKDFLDQYTTLQQMIESGEESLTNLTETGLSELQEKADDIVSLLNAWYTEHSDDIANQLTEALGNLNDWYNEHSDDIADELSDAISAFQVRAAEIVAAAVASIPADYSSFYDNAFKWMRYTTTSDDALTLPIGAYGIASNLPTNLPTGYSGGGLLVVLDRSGTGNASRFRMLFGGYSKRLWYHTGYAWVEVISSVTLSDYYRYVSALPDGANIRTVDVGVYNLVPTNTYHGLPTNYNTSLYGWAFVLRSSASGPFVILTSGPKLWVTMTTGNWLQVTSHNTLIDEKIALIGDSWTAINSTASKNWTVLMQDIGMTVANLGDGGIGFARSVSDVKYLNKISNIPNDTTIIGVSGTFNDLAAGIPVGNASDTGHSTVAGYMNEFFDQLLSAFPTVPVVCYVLGPWIGANYNTTNARQYTEVLEEICKKNNIPFKNLLISTNLRPWVDGNKAVYYNSDGVHPTSEGYKLIFKQILPLFMESLHSDKDMYISPLLGSVS